MDNLVMPAMTLDDLTKQEQEIIARRDAYVTQANNQISAFNGALQQVQAQRSWLEQKQKDQVKAASKPRRGKVKGKKEETPVVTDTVTAPEPLSA